MQNYPQNKKHMMGVVGRGINYSLSPVLHQAAAKYFGMDLEYKIFDIEQDAVKDLLMHLWSIGSLGVNITSPYKKFVATLCNKGFPINTLFRSLPAINAPLNGVFFEAASTDGLGFTHALKKIDPRLETCGNVLFLGFGDAADSILREIQQAFGMNKKIIILRRNPEIDSDLLKVFGISAKNIYFFSAQNFLELLKTMPQNSLVIQASSAPHHGNDLKEFGSALTLSGFRGTVLDLCYRPPSALISASKELGIRCQDGLPMLVEQARGSQKLWWGKSAPYELLMEVLLDYISQTQGTRY